MGFYIRKSVSVGPFRFNLSKSGIGVSTGIKGFRVGTGPRGNYVQMGRGGIYFRQTLPSLNGHGTLTPTPEVEYSSIEMKEIESGNVSQMVDSSSAALLEEINSKSKKMLIWPWILAAGICLLFLLVATNSPVWIYCLITPLSIAGLVWAIYADKLRKTVVLFYELEPHIEEAFQHLHNTFDSLRACSRMWHIESRGSITTTYDWKVNAGASAVVKRKSIAPFAGSPSYFKSNISIPALPAGRQTLFFLPDRILVWDTNGVGAVNYDQLNADYGEQRFIEDEGVPGDSRVVDKTWRYKNKKGGPDRRFNNNREIPIVIYEALMLTSKSGLRESFQISRTGLGNTLNFSVKQMASAIAERGQVKSDDGYIKCPCNNCDVFIEFPAHGLGQAVVCPHCGMDTILFKPDVI
ncbi:MAG TPA: DUF4236 domain-containing protein [Candidatus Acidoferrales bacterium]|jgi:hypothetical protein|nr:DUF4236 domain-containing protein [Candidatus Acidoferrales bacterium]